VACSGGVPASSEWRRGWDEMREIEVSTVARCDGSGWSVAPTVVRWRSCCGRELRSVVVLHVRESNRAPKRVCEERRKTRKLEE
jgi:hypothetical protein